MPSINFHGGAIIADTCLQDSVVNELWAEYFHSLRCETVPQVLYTNYRSTVGYNWDDSTGCRYLEKYEKKISGSWVVISKCLWYWDNKTRLKCYGGIDNNVQVSCCGHWHKTKPQ